ncbi:hypothetical protein ACOMHN_035864 [Nucella lapillus]
MASPVSPAGPSQAPGDDGSAAPVVEPPSTHHLRGHPRSLDASRQKEVGLLLTASKGQRTGGGSSRSSKPSLASTTSQMPATGTRLQETMR